MSALLVVAARRCGRVLRARHRLTARPKVHWSASSTSSLGLETAGPVPAAAEEASLQLPGIDDPPVSSAAAPTGDIFAYFTPRVKKTPIQVLSKQWENLDFCIRPVNGYVHFVWRGGSWDSGTFVPAPYILLHINSGALHYGISVFEGLKAFSCLDGLVRVMNPRPNVERMRRGAWKLRMPEVPSEVFVDGVMEAVKRNIEYVPPYGHNASLYIRPLLFASGRMLGLSPLAEEFSFFVTVLPAGCYFSKGDTEMGVDALVMEDHDRAAPRGTGAVKAAGNYASDLEPVHLARSMGYSTTLYLDPLERRYVEEFSVCGFVGITDDGTFVTPTSPSVLVSTTCKMLMQLARDEGIRVEERPIDFDEEIEGFAEVGMVGTAAIVVRVNSTTRGDRVYKSRSFRTLARLRDRLMAIQCGECPDVHGWMLEVEGSGSGSQAPSGAG